MKLIAIAAGGAAGAALRYAVSLLVPTVHDDGFPWATTIVNLAGSLHIGILAGLFEKIVTGPNVRSFVLIGVLGAFTTFSTFMLESARLYTHRATGTLALYVIVHNVLGLLLVFAGLWISEQVTRV